MRQAKSAGLLPCVLSIHSLRYPSASSNQTTRTPAILQHDAKPLGPNVVGMVCTLYIPEMLQRMQDELPQARTFHLLHGHVPRVLQVE